MRALALLLILGSLSLAAPTESSPAKSSGNKRTTAVRTPSRADSSTAAAARKAGPRMLEDIHIEGDIPVPQVLFVTARDQRRFLEFHHRRYLTTSLRLGQATPLPTGVVVTRMPSEPGRETPR